MQIPFLWRIMERRLFQQPDYLALEPLVKALGLVLVEVTKDRYGSSVRYRVIITNTENKANIKDCENVHRMLQTRLSLLEEDRDLDLEVSTPGITHSFKDAGEFSLFVHSICRIYVNERSEWIRGIITSSDETSLTLTQAVGEDSKEKFETYTIQYSLIQKAKLAYGWEDIS